MRFGLAQINTRPGDLPGNLELMVREIRRAHAAGCGLVVFPELSLPGYFPKDYLNRQEFVEATREFEGRLIQNLPPNLTVIFGTISRNDHRPGPRLFNQAVVADSNGIQRRINKQLIPNYDVFDEARHFASGGGDDPVIQIQGTWIGLTICEDFWSEHDGSLSKPVHGVDPVAELIRGRAVDLLVNVSASPYEVGKSRRRVDVVAGHARRHKRPAILCNLIGGQDDVLFDGGSLIVDADGTLRNQAARFREDLLIAEWPDLGHHEINQESSEGDELRQALVMGIRDYAAKTGFKSAFVGLSGGIDSALTASLATEALGAGAVCGVAMPSKYSAEISLTDARETANRLGIQFRIIPIHSMITVMERELSPHFDGRPADVTEENMQSRIRGMILMSLANKFSGLVLSTGNKSEMAMGYCTLYGDMCGAMAPLADLTKRRVYAVARTYNTGPKPLIPERTLVRPPSAELRPDQLDTDSLPPYVVLDDIVERFEEKGEGMGEIIAAGHEPNVVRRVLNAVIRNEYKRRQAPLAFKLTPKAYGSGRRMPVAGATEWFENSILGS